METIPYQSFLSPAGDPAAGQNSSVINELLRKERMLAANAAATNELLINRDLIKGITRGLMLLGDATEVDRVYLFQNGTDPETGSLVTSQKMEWTSHTIEPQIDNPDLQNVPFEAVDFFMNPLSRREPFREIIRTLPESTTKDLLSEQNILSILVLPVFDGEYFWGFAGFDDCTTERIWTEAEYSILLSFAVSVSAAVERQAVEQQLEEARRAEQLANRAKSEFLANMSHEIRTPLNGIIGFSDLLMTMGMTEVQRQYLNNIHTSAHTLMDLINDILDFSKIEAGKLVLDLQQENILELIEKTMEVVKYASLKKGIRLRLNIGSGIPTLVTVDGVRLKQVLVNLLSNAVKFTADGDVEISLSVDLPNEPGQQALFHFAVADTGIGISPENQRKIFSAFAQADTSITRKYGGTGLGLVISNKLLQMMGAELNLRSEPGKGSTFSFSLSLDYEVLDFEVAHSLDGISLAMVVDDSEINRQIMRNMLDYFNISCIECSSPGEAMALFDGGNIPDVMITDYMMPEMNGIDLVCQLRDHENPVVRNLPVILLLSTADDHLIHESCRKLKIRDKLAKPVIMNDLVEALGRIRDIDSKLGRKEPDELDKPGPVIVTERTVKILIAEDNPVNMMLAKALVSLFVQNVGIIEAKNGNEAVELYSRYHPDLILMDIQMHDKDGYTATREIREIEEGLPERVPILALTAGTILGERERCLAAGMDEYLSKPIIKEKLEEMLLKYLNK